MPKIICIFTHCATMVSVIIVCLFYKDSNVHIEICFTSCHIVLSNKYSLIYGQTQDPFIKRVTEEYI